MDAMTFVERMFDHLIWPAVILVALLLFRKPIRDRIPQLTQLRVGPVSFDAMVSHALEESHDAMADSPEPPPSEETSADRARLQRIAEISPRAAIMEAFALVDNALKGRLADLDLAPDRDALRSTQAVILAQRAGLLDPGSAEAWNNLRALSNAARHEEHFRVEREKVEDYINIATTLRAIVEEASAPSHRTYELDYRIETREAARRARVPLLAGVGSGRTASAPSPRPLTATKTAAAWNLLRAATFEEAAVGDARLARLADARRGLRGCGSRAHERVH